MKILIKTIGGNSYIKTNVDNTFNLINEIKENEYIICRKNYINNKSECLLNTKTIESIEVVKDV